MKAQTLVLSHATLIIYKTIKALSSRLSSLVSRLSSLVPDSFYAKAQELRSAWIDFKITCLLKGKTCWRRGTNNNGKLGYELSLFALNTTKKLCCPDHHQTLPVSTLSRRLRAESYDPASHLAIISTWCRRSARHVGGDGTKTKPWTRTEEWLIIQNHSSYFRCLKFKKKSWWKSSGKSEQEKVRTILYWKQLWTTLWKQRSFIILQTCLFLFERKNHTTHLISSSEELSSTNLRKKNQTKDVSVQQVALSLSVLRSRPWHCPLSWFFCHASVCWQRQLWRHTFAMAPCLGLPFQIVPTPLVSPFKLHTVQTCTETWMRKAARSVLFLKGSHLPRVLSEVNVSNKWP